MTLEELMQCANPIYEDPHPRTDKFNFLGSSFIAAFNGRTYLVTAGHVINGRPLGALRVFHPATHLPLPFKEYYPPKSRADRDDLWIFEIDGTKLSIQNLISLSPIFLNRQESRTLGALPIGSHLVVKGYPIERGQVDEVDWLLTNKSYLTDGRYVRADERPGLHHVRYFPGDHPIKDHDGMRGASWLVGDCADEKWISLLAGVHVEGGRSGDQEYMGIFIGADVLIERLIER
jgi:hypothetical protein